MAELKKEEANQLYIAKQYKQALVVYNEVIGESQDSLHGCSKIEIFYASVILLFLQNCALILPDITATDAPVT